MDFLDLGADWVQLMPEKIKKQGLAINLTKNRLELSSKWGQVGGYFSGRLTKDQMFILGV